MAIAFQRLFVQPAHFLCKLDFLCKASGGKDMGNSQFTHNPTVKIGLTKPVLGGEKTRQTERPAG